MDEILCQIQRAAMENPDKPAYLCGGQRMSYHALWQGARGIASALSGCGPAAVLAYKDGLTLQCFLGCAMAGKPYLPIDPACPPARALDIVRDAGADVLLAMALPETGIHTISRETLRAAACSHTSFDFPERSNNSPFYILYTSGSTGKPKGVKVGPRQLFHFTQWAKTLAPTGGVWLNTASYAFDLSVMALYPALTTGGCLCDLPTTEEYPALFAALAASGATALVATPSFAALCLADRQFSRQLLPRLQTFLFCGEILPHKTVTRLLERFPQAALWNCYGPTEATVAVTAVKISEDMEEIPVGYAKPGSRLMVVDSSLRPLPDKQEGQIVITGDTLAAYVHPDPEKFVLLDGRRAYLTGDAGRLEKGLLYFHGRMDRQIKYRGFRIEPSEVEAALLSLEGVEQAAALPRLRGGRVAGLAAFVAGPADTAWLRHALGGLLPPYMIPGRIIRLPRLPLGPTGKCDYNKLMEMVSFDRSY